MTRLIWFFIGIFTLPTHLAQIIPYLKRKTPPPLPLYLSSLLTNIGIALLVCVIEVSILEEMTVFLWYLLLGMILYITGVGLSFGNVCWCCCKGTNDPDEVNEELKAEFVDSDMFYEKIAKNRSSAPIIYVGGQAYHYETVYGSYRDADGNLVYDNHQEVSISYENRFQLQYKSWQEDGNPINLPNNSSIIHGYVYCSFNFDDECINIINQMRQMAYNDAKTHDSYVNVYNNFFIPQMSEKICGTTREKGNQPCITKLIPTCGGRCFIGFLKVIGYSTLVYSCWTSKGIYTKMDLVKSISMKEKGDGGFRCGFKELDIEAIANSFNSNNPNVEQPAVNEELMKQTYDYSCELENNKLHSIVVTGLDRHDRVNINGNDGNVYAYDNEPDKNVKSHRNVQISPYANSSQSPTPNYNDFQNMIDANPYLNNVDKRDEKNKIVENQSDQSLSISDGEKP